MAEWGFYGRRRERAELAQVLGRGRWFFLQISGRRRIGKTRLVQELLQPERRERVLYIQIPDSDPAGVVSTARDFMENFIEGLRMLNSKLRSCVPKKRVPATMQDSQDDDAFLVTLNEEDDSVGEALDQSGAGLALKNWESFRSLLDLQQLLANGGQKAKA